MLRPYFPARSWTVSSSTTLSRRFPIGRAIVTAWPTLVPSSDLPRGDAIDTGSSSASSSPSMNSRCQCVGLLLFRVEVLDRDPGPEPDAVARDVGFPHARELGEPQPEMGEARRHELLALERRFVLRILPQVAVRASPLDLLR